MSKKSAPQIIVALDVPSVEAVAPIVETLPAELHWYKVGLELFTAAGPHVIEILKARRKRVFLDLKLHDIPRTVERAVAAASALGVDMLTVHAGGGRTMLAAAAKGAKAAGKTRPKLVAVTVLTSLDQSDLTLLGVRRRVDRHALSLAETAVHAGIDGVVCSVHEAAKMRKKLGKKALLVTPGIRPEGSAAADQKRIATPSYAVASGSNYLVVGRPILAANDPAKAASLIMAEAATAASR